MPRFTILPPDGADKDALVTDDPTMLLTLVAHLDETSANVLQDGRYFCTLRLGGGGAWAVGFRDDIRPGDSWPPVDQS